VLTYDELNYISIFIPNDEDKRHLMMTYKWAMKCDIYLNKPYWLHNIIRTFWIDNVTKISISAVPHRGMNRIPKNVRHITTYRELKSKYIPNNTTHLIFGGGYDEPLDECLPSSITHLKFCYFFNQPIKDKIPWSVTHLSLGHAFNQEIDGYLPTSITHLEINGYVKISDSQLCTIAIY